MPPRGPSKNVIYTLVVTFATALGLAASGIVYTNSVAEENTHKWRQVVEDNNRKWCGVLRIYHEAAKGNPAPSTPYGKQILAELESLFTEFHCDQVPEP